jgi:hypothetical protein
MPDRAEADMRYGIARWRYGLYAVLAGMAALVLVFFFAIYRLPDAGSAAAAMGPVLAAIATLAGAYFGIQAGAAGKERSDQAAYEAHSQAVQLAAIADPAQAAAVLKLPPTGGSQTAG